MEKKALNSLFIVLGLILVNSTALAEEEGFQPIFNGTDLSGWEGSPVFWSVQDGAITGQTTEDHPIPYNQFLIWKDGIPENFELRMEVRLSGDNNSGIQYRSRHLVAEGDFVVGGYQVDIHPKTEYNGMLYEEKGRGIIAQQGQKVVIDQDGVKWQVGASGPLTKTNLSQWNEYSIVVRGNRLVHKLNGNVTVDVIDHQISERSLKGIIALQIHQGPPMRVQFRNIQLKKLPDGSLLEESDTPIPNGAVKLP